MARPKSDDRRSAIMAAAMRVIAAQGLGAPTAAIAKAAGVSNGSLFTYFPTKTELLNQLYLELKTEVACAATDGLPANGTLRVQMAHAWSGQLRWALAFPEKRRAFAHLNVCEDITEESRQVGHRIMAPVAALLEQSREHGPLAKAPLLLVVGLMTAITEATIDFMAKDPAGAERHGEIGFEALCRMLE